MKKYDKTKDSGIEWLGDIPAHWSIAKVKHLAEVVNGATPDSGKDAYWDGEINWITPTDLGKLAGAYVTESKRKLTESGYKSCGTSLVPADTVILTTRAPIGNVCITAVEACTNQGCKALPLKHGNEKFLYYQLVAYREFLEMLGTGSTFLELSTDKLKEFPLPTPPLSEQRAIAAYLDHKTAQLDTLLAQKETLLQKLHQKRQALINEAVTQGLDPAAPRKPSGVAWLGDVPAHWEVKKLKRVLSNDKYAVKTGPFGSQLKADDLSDNGTIKVITQRNVLDNDFEKGVSFVSESKFEDLKSFTIEAGDILFTTRGTIGKAAIMPELDSPSILHPCLIKATINPTIIDPAWLLAFVNGSSFFVEGVKMESNSTVIDVIYSGTLKAVILPVPPLAEQKQILQKTQEKSSLIDQATATIHTQIQTLKAYRQSLISEVVTGKVDVRPAVPAPEADLPLWMQ